jgi:hypothetical protein
MASRYVRQVFRSWMSKLATPYFDTVNLEQSPQVPQWCTLEFVSASSQRSDLCGAAEETGTVTLWFFGPAGVGDDALLAAAEADAAIVLQQIDPGGKLALLGCQPPTDTGGGGDEAAFGFSFDYVYYPT